MIIQYADEYGELIHYIEEGTVVPRIGDSVSWQDEEFRVKNVMWVIEHDTVIVSITQNIVKVAAREDNNSGRLTEMHNAIIALNKKQDTNESKHNKLKEEISTIRKNINQRIQQERKGTNESR